MKKLILATFLSMIFMAQANGEILKCEGAIVNSKGNEFEKRITYYIDVVMPDENAEEYVLTLADKKTGQFKSLLQYNPYVRKTFIEIATSLDKGKPQVPERYEYIVTKMPDKNNSLYGFIYGYTPWILKVDTWIKNKPFTFFQGGQLIEGECK